jgi:hypothetical protein
MRKKLMPIVLLTAFLAACNTNNETATTEPANTETSSETASEAKVIEGYPQLSKEVAEDEALVAMKTSMGDIKIKLFPELAPKAVENFLTHAEDGYYDGLLFHRVMEGTASRLKMNSVRICTTSAEPFPWQTQVLEQMAASFSLFRQQKFLPNKSRLTIRKK